MDLIKNHPVAATFFFLIILAIFLWKNENRKVVTIEQIQLESRNASFYKVENCQNKYWCSIQLQLGQKKIQLEVRNLEKVFNYLILENKNLTINIANVVLSDNEEIVCVDSLSDSRGSELEKFSNVVNKDVWNSYNCKQIIYVDNSEKMNSFVARATIFWQKIDKKFNITDSIKSFFK